jgi:polysaccharide biosynthesis/export protein VpsN
LHVDNTILSIRKRCFAAHLQFVVALLIAFSTSFHAHADNNDYILGAGDEIRIQVYQEEDLSMVLKLDESGTFDYPYLGTITARNRTLDQLQNTVTNGLLQDVLVNPNVSVSIVKYRDFYIGGEVKKSGAYPYQPGLTVKQAITLAGGVTEWASSSKYEILREGGSVPDSASNNTYVRPGDTVTILEGLF